MVKRELRRLKPLVSAFPHALKRRGSQPTVLSCGDVMCGPTSDQYLGDEPGLMRAKEDYDRYREYPLLRMKTLFADTE
jgi:hypothetical protein